VLTKEVTADFVERVFGIVVKEQIPTKEVFFAPVVDTEVLRSACGENFICERQDKCIYDSDAGEVLLGKVEYERGHIVEVCYPDSDDISCRNLGLVKRVLKCPKVPVGVVSVHKSSEIQLQPGIDKTSVEIRRYIDEISVKVADISKDERGRLFITFS
jgi:hypothetical protein